jgi:hypothetical protein
MVINNLAQLCNWVQDQAAEVLAEYDPRLATHAVEDIASVIARHARGQQVSWGDDWGWVLEMYGPAQMREIVSESAKIHGNGLRNR